MMTASGAHFFGHRREIAGQEHAASRGEEHRLFDVDVRAVCIFQRGGDPPYVLRTGILGERALEPRVELDVHAMLAAQLLDDRSELSDVREAREQRVLFVGLVALHLTREERGDVACGRLVEAVAARRLRQRREGLFEPSVRPGQLLEGVIH